MSIDTIERLVDFTECEISIPNGYYVIDASLNEGLPEQGSGPFIVLNVEEFSNDVVAVKRAGSVGYLEEGVIIYNIFDEKGSGTRDPYVMMDVIRDSFRGDSDAGGYKKLYDSDNGTIAFYEISQRRPVEVNRSNSGIDWVRHDLLVSYVKYYDS